MPTPALTRGLVARLHLNSWHHKAKIAAGKSFSPGTSRNSPSGGCKDSGGHVAAKTGHALEIGGHGAESGGHVGRKYAVFPDAAAS